MNQLGDILGHLGAILVPDWGYLGSSLSHLDLLEPILGHLGAILGQLRAILGSTWGQLDQQAATGKLACWFFDFILGPKTGPKSVFFCSVFGSIFRQICGQFLVYFWTTLGARSGPRPAQEAPRWAPEGHQDLQSTEKPTFAKTIKNIQVF